MREALASLGKAVWFWEWAGRGRQGTSREETARQVNSTNPFTTLESLRDTILEGNLEHRLQRTAYLLQELKRYRMPYKQGLAAETEEEFGITKEDKLATTSPL
jgi:hypothetical protein